MESTRKSEKATNETEKVESRSEFSNSSRAARGGPAVAEERGPRKRPEIARYQPPGSRPNEGASSGPTKTTAANEERPPNDHHETNPKNGKSSAGANRNRKSEQNSEKQANSGQNSEPRADAANNAPSTSAATSNNRNPKQPTVQSNHSKSQGPSGDSRGSNRASNQEAGSNRDRNQPQRSSDKPRPSEKAGNNEPARQTSNANANANSRRGKQEARGGQRPERAPNQGNNGERNGNRSEQGARPPPNENSSSKSKKTENDRRLFKPGSSENKQAKLEALYDPNEPPRSAREAAPPAVASKSGGGGLLKLNPNALSQMRASMNDRVTSSTSSMASEPAADDHYAAEPSHPVPSRSAAHGSYGVSQHHQNNSSGRRMMGGGRSSATNVQNPESVPSGQLKMLFDPNNPSKPIYIQDNKSGPNNPRHQPVLSKVTSDVARMSISPNKNNNDLLYHPNYHGADARHHEQHPIKPVQEMSAEAGQVHYIAQDMQKYEQKLKHLVDLFDIRQPIDAFVAEIAGLRKQIEEMCVECLFLHIETASNINVDLNHWRSCYHQLIEALRKEYQHTGYSKQQQHYPVVGKEQMNALGSALADYIEEGLAFYAGLIERIEHEFVKFNIGEFIDFNFSNRSRIYDHAVRQRWMNKQSKHTKFALICLNRFFISMGDLTRYKELIFGAPAEAESSAETASGGPVAIAQRDYSQARSFYLKALYIAPRSSRAYHQLAVLAMYTRRRLDAAYYYFRCLEVSTPLTSVRQALYSLFDEARQRSDFIMKLIKQAMVIRQKKRISMEANPGRNHADEKNRVEIWYKPPLALLSGGSGEDRSVVQKSKKETGKAKNDASALEKDEIEQADSDEEDDEDEDESSSDEESNDEDDFDAYLNSEELESGRGQRDVNELRNAMVKDKNLSVNELNKRFMLNYLNSIGKLFSKVGMEQYPDVCSRMLHEFRELLGRQPCPLGKMRLLQLTLINISMIDICLKQSTVNYYSPPHHHLHQQANGDSSHQPIVQRSQLLECAIQLSFDMFAIISKRFTFLLKKYTKPTNNEDQDEENDSKEANDLDSWQLLIPSIKLFVDWILCNSKICFPLPDQLPPDLGPSLNRWKIISNMLNLVHKLVNTTRYFEPSDDLEREILKRVKLEEDIETAGFVPLLSLPREDNYDSSEEEIRAMDARLTELFNTERDKFDKKVEKACNLKRMEKLCLFADYLCGLEQPIFKYDVVNKCYYSVAHTAQPFNSPSSPPNNPVFNRLMQGENRRTISTCSSSSNTSNPGASEMAMESMASIKYFNEENEEEAGELLKLKEKRRQLQSKMEEQAKRDQSLVEMGKQRRLELEIRPKFVVPDTNCFIDHLNLIKSILGTNYFIVVIPLLVINELDKLAKSVLHYNYDSVEHAEFVQRNAKIAIQYLTEKFENRERNLKALTSQGSVLETIQFRSEEIRGQGTNDELILGCCLHYCRDNARDFMPNSANDAIHLYREVVLLTEDRHLRLKAHTRNVPVKDILNFCKWCNLLSPHNSVKNAAAAKTKPAQTLRKK